MHHLEWGMQSVIETITERELKREPSLMTERVAFQLKLRKGAADGYDAAHREVWPEMLALLKRAGVREYSIFRRDELLILYMQVDDFEQTWAVIDKSPVNERWQTAMAKYFEPVQELRPGERFAMMPEVFYMP